MSKINDFAYNLKRKTNEVAQFASENFFGLAVLSSVAFTAVNAVNSVRATNAEVASKKAYAAMIKQKTKS